MSTKKILNYLNPELFTWSRWRAGTIADLKIPCRYGCITSGYGKSILRKHFVGYCDAKYLLCRPKVNEKAVMFFNEGIHFWGHLRNKEFFEVFENET